MLQDFFYHLEITNDNLAKLIKNGFESQREYLNTRLDAVDKCFEEVDKQFATMEDRFDKIELHLEQIKPALERISALETRAATMEKNIERLQFQNAQRKNRCFWELQTP